MGTMAGFLVGRYLAPSGADHDPRSLSRNDLPLELPQRALSASPHAADTQLPRAVATPAEPLQERFRTLKALNALRANRGVHLMVPVFDPTSERCRLTNAIAALFEMTAGERTQMDGHMARAQEEIDRMRVEHATSESGEDGSWIISVPAFPERGGVVYEQMLASISAVLGPERTGSFLEIAGPAIESQVGAFGAAEGRIILFPGTVSPAGEITYRVSESAESWGTQGNSVGEFSQQNIEARYGTVVRHHVPAQFWHPK